MTIADPSDPRISVVVCSLNGEAHIGRCLAALAAQRHDSFEVIVVDDGSTDATGSIALAAGARVVHHATPRGLSAARNAGLREARGAIVAFTDDELAAAYREAWVFCLPSDYEGFGVPYIEAMASGVPVVATPNPGAVFVTDQGRAGVLAVLPDVGRAVLDLLQDHTRREALTAVGAARADVFDLGRVVAAYEALYRG
jgi:glycosyltransferase involved in cell wall biosynthesis